MEDAAELFFWVQKAKLVPAKSTNLRTQMEVGIKQIFLTKEGLTVPRLACSEVREKEMCPLPSLPQNVPINDRYSHIRHNRS
jgi:hypothetical protein